MQKLRIAVVVGVMVALGGVANAVDYVPAVDNGTYIFTNPANWSPSGVPGLDNIDGAADTISFPAQPVGSQGLIINIPNGASASDPPVVLYVGEIILDNGQLNTSSTYAALFNLHVRDDLGESGDLIIRNAGYMAWNNNSFWEVDGDFRVRNGGMRNYSLQSLTLTMNGVGKVVDVDQSDWLGRLIIPEGASISGGDGTGALVRASNLELYGTFTGNIEVLGDVIVGENATWSTGVLSLRRQSGTSTTRIFASQLPGFDGNSNGYINASPNPRRTVRLMQDLTVANNLLFNVGYTSYDRNWNDILTTDNGSGSYSDLTVNGNMGIGGGTRVSTTIRHGFEANSSQVTIGGNFTVDRYGYVVGGTSQWDVKGNMVFTSLARIDLSSMDNTVVNITGSSAQTLDFASALTMGSLNINKTGGTANLADNLLLAGNLQILAGGFNTNGYVVTFNGPDHTLNDQVGVTFDNIALLANAVVQMASDITVNNLIMGADSEIYLNGFTLTAEGTPYSGAGQWSFEGGTIFGDTNIPGDANNDGKVDSTDLGIWQQNYDPIGNVNNTFAMGDFDGDTKIDSSDLGIWQQNYDPIGSSGAGMGTQVPEPATLLLVGSGLLGGLGVLRRRRSK